MASRLFSFFVAAALCVAGYPNAASAAPTSTTTTVARFASILSAEGSRLSEAGRLELARRILLLASYYQLDARLLVALVSSESAWQPHAASPVGARGLGQLMPGTARSLDVDPLETYENLDGTARYLRRMINRAPAHDLRERYRLALASYNAGPAAVTRYGGIPPYAETRNYVAIVMARYDAFCRLIPSIGTPPLIAELPPPAAPLSMPRASASPRPRLAVRAVRRVTPAAPDTVTIVVALHSTPTVQARIPRFNAQPGPLMAYRPAPAPLPTPVSGLQLAFARFHQLRGDAAPARPTPEPEPLPTDEPVPVAEPTSSAFGLHVPERVAAGDPILVDILNAGDAPVTVVETVGGQVVDRWLAAYGRHLMLKSPDTITGTNVIVVKAYGPGNVIAQATLIADPANAK